MSINKALKQVMMYEEIGGGKKKNPEPMDTKPVRMPEPRRPGTRTPTGGNVPPPPPPSPIRMPEPRRPVSRDERRPGTRTPIGGNVPPPPPPSPTDGGAEVTPPQGLPESMKAFWKQRIENQLNEKRGLGSVLRPLGKFAGKYVFPPLGIASDAYELYDIYKNPQNYPGPKSPQGPPPQTPTSPAPQIAPKY